MIISERINFHSVLLIFIYFVIFYYKFMENLPITIDIMQVDNGGFSLIEPNSIDTIKNG